MNFEKEADDILNGLLLILSIDKSMEMDSKKTYTAMKRYLTDKLKEIAGVSSNGKAVDFESTKEGSTPSAP